MVEYNATHAACGVRLRIGKNSFLLIPQTDGVLMMDLSLG